MAKSLRDTVIKGTEKDEGRRVSSKNNPTLLRGWRRAYRSNDEWKLFTYLLRDRSESNTLVNAMAFHHLLTLFTSSHWSVQLHRNNEKMS